MLLSIVIPHYNAIEMLKKLVDSIPVINEIEIIVVDDKSDKKLDELLKMKSNNNYSHVLFLENNTGHKGAGACRNIGISVAKGDWILFADSDDFFVDGFYSIIRQYFSSDYDVIFFTPTSIEIDTNSLSDRHLNYKSKISDYLLKKDKQSELALRYTFHVPWSKLIRVKFLKKHNLFFDEVIAANDVMFSAKVGHYMKKFHASNEVIYCVTKNKGSLTVNISQKVFDSRLFVHIRFYQFLKKNLSSKQFKCLNIKGGMEYVVSAFRNHYGFKKVISTYLTLRKSKIKVFEIIYINPIYLIRKMVFHYKFLKKNKRYFVR